MNTKLIPREVLFGIPDRTNVQISPDGKYISYVAPYKGVPNLYIAKTDQLEYVKQVTKDEGRGITSYGWAYNSNYMFYIQDKNGDEDFHIYKIDLRDNSVTNLTPFKGVRAQIQSISYKHLNEILVLLNKRDKSFFDLYKLDLNTNKLSSMHENQERYASYFTDNDYKIRFFKKMNEGGGATYFKNNNGVVSKFKDIAPEDLHNTMILGFNHNKDKVYYLSSKDRDKSALMSVDIESGKEELLYQNDKVDVNGILVHPKEKNLRAAMYSYDKPQKVFFDDSFKGHFEFLDKKYDGVPFMASGTLDDKMWVVKYINDDSAISYHLFDTQNQKLTFLFKSRSELDQYQLSKMHPVEIKTRDDLTMMRYLTTPVGHEKLSGSYIPKKPLPLILDVHGGPTVRDGWGINMPSQWFANRGYAVLKVNYRGSSGFGKNFINAGNGEWGGKMQDDLIDAVNWAIKEKIAAKDKVCIYGGSYGGYAVLAGLTFTPDVFTCGVDIVGISDLILNAKNKPSYWAYYMDVYRKKIGGNPETEEGRKFLASRSPINFVDRIKKPLLIAQGKHDPRVKKEQSDVIVEEMKKMVFL